MKKLILLVAFLSFAYANVNPIFANNSNIESTSGKQCKIKKECLAATSEDNFKSLNQVCNRKDEAALKRMIAAGQVYVLKPYYSVTMLDYGFSKCKIHVVQLDTDVWVSTEFIEYK